MHIVTHHEKYRARLKHYRRKSASEATPEPTQFNDTLMRAVETAKSSMPASIIHMAPRSPIFVFRENGCFMGFARPTTFCSECSASSSSPPQMTNFLFLKTSIAEPRLTVSLSPNYWIKNRRSPDLDSRLRFGPDFKYIDQELSYQVDETKADAFFQSACKTIDGLQREGVGPYMAGIRPKFQGTGVKDFVIEHEIARNLPGFINLIGIVSPGLTSALAITNQVARWTKEILS